MKLAELRQKEAALASALLEFFFFFGGGFSWGFEGGFKVGVRGVKGLGF